MGLVSGLFNVLPLRGPPQVIWLNLEPPPGCPKPRPPINHADDVFTKDIEENSFYFIIRSFELHLTIYIFILFHFYFTLCCTFYALFLFNVLYVALFTLAFALYVLKTWNSGSLWKYLHQGGYVFKGVP